MMAKDKIRPAAIKVGIQLEPGQRFGFHNFRHSLATFAQLNLHRARIHRNRQRPPSNGLIERARSTAPQFGLS